MRHDTEPHTATALGRFTDQRVVLLTTYRRDGREVGTPVNLAVEGDRAFVRSWATSGKAKRLRRDPAATIAPSTFRGRPTGPALAVELRRVTGDDEDTARRLLRRKHPVMHGVLVPLAHRVQRLETVHYEVRPAG